MYLTQHMEGLTSWFKSSHCLCTLQLTQSSETW